MVWIRYRLSRPTRHQIAEDDGAAGHVDAATAFAEVGAAYRWLLAEAEAREGARESLVAARTASLVQPDKLLDAFELHVADSQVGGVMKRVINRLFPPNHDTFIEELLQRGSGARGVW